MSATCTWDNFMVSAVGGTYLWAQQDADYNVTALVNNSGTVVERYAYDPFGARTIYDANWNVRGASSFNLTYGYQGRPHDTISGDINFRNRIDSPTLGRPLQQDPIGFAGGTTNLYQWEGDSPLASTDPSGLEDISFDPDKPKPLEWKEIRLVGLTKSKIPIGIELPSDEGPAPTRGPDFNWNDPRASFGWYIQWKLGFRGPPVLVPVRPPMSFGDMSMVGGGLPRAPRKGKCTKIEGKPDSPRTLPHQASQETIAEMMKESGRYDRVGMNRPLSEFSGRVHSPDIRPDNIGLRPDGRIDMMEVVSPSQTAGQLRRKLEDAMRQLPPEQRGIILVVDPSAN
jgi:RHS repeat-associated protein